VADERDGFQQGPKSNMRWAILILGLSLTSAAAAQPIDSETAPQLNRLHDQLRLSAAQEPAWSAYKRAIAPNAQVQARHRATDQMLPTLPTPRRIALIAATMAADEADFHKQGAAVTAFYNQLTAAQQRTFDAETVPASGNPR
jgi:hypothetical protein